MMAIFKIEAEGDVVYVEADSEQLAKEHLFAKIGDIPESLLTVSEVSELPADEELL